MRRLMLSARPLLRLYHPPRPAVLSFPPPGHPPARTFHPAMAYLDNHLTAENYNMIANATLESFYDNLETEAEERPEVDVEYSAGVLTLKLPQGTYVLNKQPSNRQIWLSSPISGPKRYDWDDSQRAWIYSRDGSDLGKLLKEETGVGFEVNV